MSTSALTFVMFCFFWQGRFDDYHVGFQNAHRVIATTQLDRRGHHTIPRVVYRPLLDDLIFVGVTPFGVTMQ